MKKLLRLTGNEIKKIWKQTGYRIVLFIILGIILLVPVVITLVEGNNEYTPEDQREVYLDLADDYSSDAMCVEYYTSYADSYNFFIENDLSDSWKFRIYSSEYSFAFMKVYALNLVLNRGFEPKEVYSWFAYPESFEEGYYYDVDFSKLDFDELYTEAKTELKALEDKIKTVTEKDYFKGLVETQNQSLEEMRILYQSSLSAYNQKPTNESLKYELDRAELQLIAAQYSQKATQLLYDTNAEPNGWAHKLVSNYLGQALYSYQDTAAMPEQMYESESNYFSVSTLTYEQYVKQCEKNRNTYLKAINTYIYAIENNVQPRGVGENSGGGFFGGSGTVKAMNFSAIGIMTTMLTVFMVVVASGMISSEYSSGTIRMLLIRPCSRRQIIGSKLLALLVIFLALSIGMMLIMTLELIIFNGVDDLFVNDIVCIGDAIGQVPAFLGTLGHFALCALPALLLVSFTTMLASSTKKNGLTTTLSMLALFFSSLVVEIGILLMSAWPEYFSWLAYTPIVYTSLSDIVSPAYTLISNGYMYEVYNMNLWIGVAYNLLFFGGFIWLTFLAFRKSQVKS